MRLRSGGAVDLLPGVLLCVAITVAASLVETVEADILGRAWLESLVLAILIGTALRTAWTPGKRWQAGIKFCAKTLLEVAVFLLGASISLQTILAVGGELVVGIAVVVAVAIVASYTLGRAFGLPRRMAILVACGNSICGNSAIAAVAPVIGADSRDIASSIAFTAVLGVIVVLLLPLAVPLLHLSGMQYGVLAGLTVYAVPQVLAATAPIGALSVQIGTLVKLVRVLMLGPVVVGLSLVSGRFHDDPSRAAPVRPAMHKLVPWFILGFLALAGLRSAGMMPLVTLRPIGWVAGWLTVLSMAALGLGVDIRVVARAGARVTLTVTASLLLLGAISYGLIRLVGVA